MINIKSKFVKYNIKVVPHNKTKRIPFGVTESKSILRHRNEKKPFSPKKATFEIP